MHAHIIIAHRSSAHTSAASTTPTTSPPLWPAAPSALPRTAACIPATCAAGAELGVASHQRQMSVTGGATGRPIKQVPGDVRAAMIRDVATALPARLSHSARSSRAVMHHNERLIRSARDAVQPSRDARPSTANDNSNAAVSSVRNPLQPNVRLRVLPCLRSCMCSDCI